MKNLVILLFSAFLFLACDFGFDETLDDEIHSSYTFFAYQDASSANESVSYEVGQSVTTLPDFQSADGVNRLKAGYYPDGWIFWKNSDTGNTEPLNIDSTDGLVSSFRVNPARASFYASGWSAINYFVHFDANGGYGTMSDMTMTYDSQATLSANAFARNGYEFRGWSTDASSTSVQYADGATVKNLTAAKEKTVNLYALWLKTHITISFDAGGGTGTMSAISATVDETTAPACAFSKANHVFAYWKSTVRPEITFSEGEVLTEAKWPNADDTFVACWKPVFELGTPTIESASVTVQSLGSSSVTLTTSASGLCIWSVNGTKVSEASSCTINYSDYPSGGTITFVCLTSSGDVLQYKNTFTIN